MNTQEELKNKNGFDILRDYFSSVPQEKSLWTNKRGDHLIDISWFFTEDIPREIITKTISRLMQTNNDRYERKSRLLGKKPEDIQSVAIHTYQDELSLIFTGADNWTKLNLANSVSPNNDFSIPTISIQQFEKEICKTIIEDKNPDYTPFLKGINTNLNNSCKNLVEYYKYLLEEKTEHTTYSCLINVSDQTPSDRHRAPSGNSDSTIPYNRKNDVIPFHLRSQVLDDNEPICMINVNEKKENGDIVHNSYITYVYDHVLKNLPEQNKKGYLFISEPLSGERSTRLYYVSAKEFEAIRTEKSEHKFESIVKKNLELNQEEFLRAGNAQIAHTSIDSYADRINYFLNGDKGQSLSDYSAYLPRLQKLYRDDSITLPYYNPRVKVKDVAILGLNPEGKIDRTAQALTRAQESSKKVSVIKESPSPNGGRGM